MRSDYRSQHLHKLTPPMTVGWNYCWKLTFFVSPFFFPWNAAKPYDSNSFFLFHQCIYKAMQGDMALAGHTNTQNLYDNNCMWFLYPQFDKIWEIHVVFVSSNRQDPANTLFGWSAWCQIRHYVLLHVAPRDAEVTSRHRNELNAPSLIQSLQANPVLSIQLRLHTRYFLGSQTEIIITIQNRQKCLMVPSLCTISPKELFKQLMCAMNEWTDS